MTQKSPWNTGKLVGQKMPFSPRAIASSPELRCVRQGFFLRGAYHESTGFRAHARPDGCPFGSGPTRQSARVAAGGKGAWWIPPPWMCWWRPTSTRLVRAMGRRSSREPGSTPPTSNACLRTAPRRSLSSAFPARRGRGSPSWRIGPRCTTLSSAPCVRAIPGQC